MPQGFDIPNLLYFQSGNIYSGSLEDFGYKLLPEGENLRVCVWKGPFCMEKSEILASREFPLTAKGREETISWLRAEYEKEA